MVRVFDVPPSMPLEINTSIHAGNCLGMLRKGSLKQLEGVKQGSKVFQLADVVSASQTLSSSPCLPRRAELISARRGRGLRHIYKYALDSGDKQRRPIRMVLA